MADKQPPNVTEGATTGDIEEDQARPPPTSAEDRKAASALANLDGDETTTTSSSAANVDAAAISKATKVVPSATPAAAPKKNVKIDAADVTLLVEECELSKVKATELLRSFDGSLEATLRDFVKAA